MRILIILVIMLLSIALGLVFIALNSARVDINFFFFQMQGYPLAIGMFLALAFGALLGILASLGMIISLRLELKRVRRQTKNVELELSKLRTLPLDNE